MSGVSVSQWDSLLLSSVSHQMCQSVSEWVSETCGWCVKCVSKSVRNVPGGSVGQWLRNVLVYQRDTWLWPQPRKAPEIPALSGPECQAVVWEKLVTQWTPGCQQRLFFKCSLILVKCWLILVTPPCFTRPAQQHHGPVCALWQLPSVLTSTDTYLYE